LHRFFFYRLDFEEIVTELHGHILFQFKQAEETAKKLDLDGIVVIGGDDSNTNACLLAENFRYGMCLCKEVFCYDDHF
jgi:6-phosphofructokinase